MEFWTLYGYTGKVSLATDFFPPLAYTHEEALRHHAHRVTVAKEYQAINQSAPGATVVITYKGKNLEEVWKETLV